MVWCASDMTAQETKQCYGIIDKDSYANGKGVYTFDFDGKQVTNFKKAYGMMADQVSGACLVNGIYYWFDYTVNSRGHTSNGFYSFDIETGEIKQIANYGNMQGGDIVSHLTYDYTTQTMYGIWGPESGLSLGKIDLETGEMTKLETFHLEEWPSIADSLYENGQRVYAVSVKNMFTSIAISYDGDMYGLEFCGGLYRINKVTGDCTYIGRLNHLKENDFRNANCLFFDNDSGRLYLRGQSHNYKTGDGCIYLQEVDPKTACVTPIEEWSYNDEDQSVCYLLKAIYVPFLPAEASAPAKVQNVVVKAGDEGVLTASLEWDNPSKTYGRGGQLEELTSVVVYREGEEVWRNDQPAIGGHETFIDQLPKRGFYSYRIVGFNTMGKGDRYNHTLYVGEDDPRPVGNLSANAEGYGARVSWTAPMKGKYDAWINTSKLKYDIVRQPDGIKVGSDVTECTFLDDQLPEYDHYTYEVTPKTDYMGIMATSDKIIAGPSFSIPVSFPLRDYQKLLLWKTVDLNENYSCWGMNPSIGEGAYCQYAGDGLAAADWLISPPVAFKAGQHYKLTFEAESGNKLIRELLTVTWGASQDIMQQDSLTQFAINHDGPLTLRVNLPVLDKDRDMNVGFFYCSNIQDYQLLLRDVVISEDHEGYIDGHITDTDGHPVVGATVRAANGKYQSLTDSTGYYKLDYLPAGKYTIQAVCLGYQNKTQTGVVVTELQTTTQDITITPLPTYSVTGRVIDAADDVVCDAEITISGYHTYRTMTDEKGEFTFPAVYKNNNYSIEVYKLGYVVLSKLMPVSGDTDLGTLVIDDDVKAPKGVSVTVDDQSATVSWRVPVGNPQLYRIDDGGYTTSVGYNGNVTSDHVFGVINRVPATVYNVQFLLTAPQGQEKDSVVLRLIDLDEDGMPNGKVLFERNVPCHDAFWVTYTLPTPVEAPHGYYTCLGYNGFLGIAIDGTDGDAENYPFVKGVNCFGLYTTGEYYFLDNQSSPGMRHNFCIRTYADPYDDEFASSRRIVQDRVRYNVYRMENSVVDDESAWTLLSQSQRERCFTDSGWKDLPQGVYRYAVKAVYAGEKLSAAALTDSVGNKMYTTVRFHIATDTPDDESWGAIVTLSNGFDHIYTAEVEDGLATIEKVWKDNYTVTVVLDGFTGVNEQKDLSQDQSYDFSYMLNEIRVQPFNLIIEDVEGTLMAEKRFIWNFPDYFFDDFEQHEDFVVNSPGAIGWNYIDGDGGETGGFRGFERWGCMYQPMAFCVFNAYSIKVEDGEGTMADNMLLMRSHSGHKQLTSWASNGVANDDWLITPRLYFKQPFTFSFWARSYDAYSYPEIIEVRYSTTGMEKEDFTEVAMGKTKVRIDMNSQDYIFYEVELPAEARYVALHHLSDQRRVLSVDDVFVGLRPDAARAGSQLKRSPALEGQYEVYLDGVKVADTDETSYVFAHLSQGHHTAGVLASYTSGKTAMSTIDFESSAVDGIEYFALPTQQIEQVYDLQGRQWSKARMPKGVYLLHGRKHVVK